MTSKAFDNVVKLNNLDMTSVTAFGAKGDGVTNDLAAIQAAIDFVANQGGGEVYFPAGTYITNNNIRIRDNVYLRGEGYSTRIHNIAAAGFAKCTLITGNIGDPGNGNSLFDEAGYDIDAVAIGDKSVTLITAGDASNFAVGDIVGIASFETWTPPVGTHEKYLNVNEVVAINSGVITLRYALPDTLASSGGSRPTIRRLSGTINGYDGQPLFAAKNCGAFNMRVTQLTGLTSGWYALFPCGINQQFEKLWLDDCSTLVGTNALGHAVFRDIEGRFEAGFLDFAEWQNNLLVENVHGTRFAANPNLNRLGLSNNNGTDNVFRNVTAFLDGFGRFSLTKIFRGRFENCRIVDSGSAADTVPTEAILLGYGTDCEAIGCSIENQYLAGIACVGERHRISRCRIPSTGSVSVGSYAVYAPAGVNVIYVHDNEFGTVGSYTPRDRFFQQTAQSSNARVYNNTGYVEDLARQGGVLDAAFAQTSQTGSYAVLKTTNVKGRTGLVSGFRIKAGLIITGTTSTKLARIQLGANPVITANITASPAGVVLLEADIITNTADSVRGFGTAIQETSVLDSSGVILAAALQSDTTITLEAQVANAADTIAVYQWVVEPLPQRF